jgi:hypothetical protein
MKILIAHDGSLAHYFTRLGLARAYVASGHEATIWDIRQKSTFDAFDEFEPDIFEGQTYNLGKDVIECLYQRPHILVYLKASDWGPKTYEIASKYPVLTAKQEEIDNILELKRRTGKPDFVFVHHHKDWLKDTHGYWEENGIKTVSVMNAADTFDFTNGEKKSKYECDIGYVGGSWPFKDVIINKWFRPLLQDFKYSIKIFGNQGWIGTPQYCGFIPDNEVKNFFASANINLSFSEPHSHEYGYDVTEKFAKIISNKSFLISDYVEGLNKMFTQDEIILCKTPNDMWEKIDYYLTNPNKKIDIIQNGYNKVIKEHTYFNRAFEIFISLGLKEAAENVLIKRNIIFKESNLM